MPRSLTSLPPEVLSLIVESLCPVRSSGVLVPPNKLEVIWQLTMATQNLYMSCKLFKKMIEPYLFIELAHSSYKSFCRQARRDPSLSACVRSLNHDALQAVSTYGAKLVIQESQKQREDTTATDRTTALANGITLELLPYLERYSLEIHEGWDDEDLQSHEVDKDFRVYELVTHLPNLAALDIVCCNESTGIFSWNPTQLALIGSSTNLQRLRLDGQNLSRDSKYGKGLKEADNAGHYLAGLAPGMANLRVLELTDCAISSDPFFMNYLEQFIALCANLEKLIIEEASGIHSEPRRNHEPAPPPADIVDAILPVRETLRHLELIPSEDWEFQPHGLIRPGQLADFTQLRTLMMHETCFCRRLVDEDGDVVDQGLIDILPSSVETLIVAWEEEAALADLEALVARTDEFPALKKARAGPWGACYNYEWKPERVLLDR